MSQGEAPGGAGCRRDEGIQASCWRARRVRGSTETLIYVCLCVSGQEAAGESEDSGPTAGGVRIVHVYFYIYVMLTDFGIPIYQRGEQDEAAGVSAECSCLCWPVGAISAYITLYTRVCALSCWESTLSLTAGWTQGRGAASASPLSGYQI